MHRPFSPERIAVTGMDMCNALGGDMTQQNGPAGFCGQERVLDGVRLINFVHQGKKWRLGTTVPAWIQELAMLPVEPTQSDLTILSRKGLWLAPTTEPPTVAVMCCGLGSVWPGMGRALYDTFPVARAAMDRIAAVADWNVLSLMDETELEKIAFTRWQQPYLFLLEFAQASYLKSLGFTPKVMSGHSFGEFIALCLAGVLTLEQGWRILEFRAKQTAALEASADKSTGMMAVYGVATLIEDILQRFPDLRVSNYNTPTQFILSGPRATLTEARRSLRKNKVPAIILNMSIAFHHPGMRVLREALLNHINNLDIRPAHIPMISYITTGLYPSDRASIAEYIADLDENAVRWVECVHAMWHTHNVRHFVEFGPTDTLCGLTADIRPEAVCISAGRKDKEVEGMRTAVARLHALGHLSRPTAGRRVASPDPAALSATTSPVSPPVPPHVEDIMPLIMNATGYTREELLPDMDLRHDLAIRSSRFPAIMYAAERCFQITVRFEDLMGIATIRDLADTMARLRNIPLDAASTPSPATPTLENRNMTEGVPVLRFLPQWQDLDTSQLPAPLKEYLVSPVLVVGDTITARRWVAELTTAPVDILTAQNIIEALALLRSAETPPCGLILAHVSPISQAEDGSPTDDPTHGLACSQEVLQVFLANRHASFCLACAEYQELWGADTGERSLGHPLWAGLTGLLLSGALEYPKVMFRSVLAHVTAPGTWMPRALNPAFAPVQWWVESAPTPGVADLRVRTPRLRAYPADPHAGLPLRPADVIVVSGGGRGITPHALEGLAAQDCVLVMLGRSPSLHPTTEQRLESLGATVRYHACDITKPSAVEAAINAVYAEFGHIDGILHAAGLNHDATLATLSREDMESVMAVKCRGLHHLLSATTQPGRIRPRWAVAFSSLAAWLGHYGQTHYSAAHRAMAALLERWCLALRIPWRCIWLPPITGDGMAGSEEMREQLRLRGLDNAWIDARELGLLLARELHSGQKGGGGQVVWARNIPHVPGVAPAMPHSETALRGLVERPERFPLVYPVALVSGVPTEFTGGHDFSHYSNVCLHKQEGDTTQTTAPQSLLLHCLVEGATQPAAWLCPVGLEQVSMGSSVICPKGVTREGRIRMRSGTWRKAEGHPARLPWEGAIEVRDITANGRRKDSWTRACTGSVLLAGTAPSSIPPLWEAPPPRLWPTHDDVRCGMGMLHPCPDTAEKEHVSCIIDLSPLQTVAGENILRYDIWGAWMELFHQAARQALPWNGKGIPCIASLEKLLCVPLPAHMGRALLEVRKRPDIGNISMFDAQAVSEDATVLVTLNRLVLYTLPQP